MLKRILDNYFTNKLYDYIEEQVTFVTALKITYKKYVNSIKVYVNRRGKDELKEPIYVLEIQKERALKYLLNANEEFDNIRKEILNVGEKI